MKTIKERLATAIHTPLNETLSFYKTSLTGLTEEQVGKIVTYMAKTPSLRVKKTVSSKKFTNLLSIHLQSSFLSSR